MFTFFLSATTESQEKDSIAEALKLQIKQADFDSLRVELMYNLVQRAGKTQDMRARENQLLVLEDILDIIENKELNTPYFQRKKAESLQGMATLTMDTRNWADLQLTSGTAKNTIKLLKQ